MTTMTDTTRHRSYAQLDGMCRAYRDVPAHMIQAGNIVLRGDRDMMIVEQTSATYRTTTLVGMELMGATRANLRIDNNDTAKVLASSMTIAQFLTLRGLVTSGE